MKTPLVHTQPLVIDSTAKRRGWRASTQPPSHSLTAEQAPHFSLQMTGNASRNLEQQADKEKQFNFSLTWLLLSKCDSFSNQMAHILVS